MGCPLFNWILSNRLDPSNHKKMQWVVYVEKVFHHPVYAAVFAQLSIVHPDHRDCQHNGHLDDSIGTIQRKEIDGCIHRHIENHKKHLLFEISTIGAKCQNAKAGNTAPIAGERDQTDGNDENRLDLLLYFGAVSSAEHDQSPCKGPHDTCLVQDLPIIKGNEGFPINIIGGKINIGKMRNDGKYKQAPCVEHNILCIVEAFRNEIAHDWAGDSTNDVHHHGNGIRRISGEQHPGNMVDRHGNDRNHFDCICI